MSTLAFSSPWLALKADTFRMYGRFSGILLTNGAITSRTFRPIVTMRLCQLVSISRFSFILLFFKVLHGLATHIAGIDLSWRTNIGPGFAIFHGRGIVINTNAIVGKNVTVLHGVTIGSRARIAPNGTRTLEYPVIEDGVCIGPNAIIVGGVRIGTGSRIAGGAFITQNIPPYSVVGGNPAVILKNNCIPDIVNPA